MKISPDITISLSAMDTEKLCLQWNDFKENIISSFGNLRGDREFTDVTLACEDGQQIEAHKVVLASSSPFFMELLMKNKHPHPLIYMRGLKSKDLAAILDFLYFGEANVIQEGLDTFLALAGELKLKGLTGTSDDDGLGNNKEIQSPVMKYENLPKRHTGKKMQQSSETLYSTPETVTLSIQPKNSTTDSGTTVAVVETHVSVNLEDLDDQIRSMITKSDVNSATGQGKMASCNACGKQGPLKFMPQHIEAYHITGLSHPCNTCGKISRSRDGLRRHNFKHHFG